MKPLIIEAHRNKLKMTKFFMQPSWVFHGGVLSSSLESDACFQLHHASKQAGHKSPDITLRIYSRSDDPDRKRAYDDKNPDDDVE